MNATHALARFCLHGVAAKPGCAKHLQCDAACPGSLRVMGKGQCAQMCKRTSVICCTASSVAEIIDRVGEGRQSCTNGRWACITRLYVNALLTVSDQGAGSSAQYASQHPYRKRCLVPDSIAMCSVVPGHKRIRPAGSLSELSSSSELSSETAGFCASFRGRTSLPLRDAP